MKLNRIFNANNLGAFASMIFLGVISQVATATKPVFFHQDVVSLWSTLPESMQQQLLEETLNQFPDLPNDKRYNDISKELGDGTLEKVVPNFEPKDSFQRKLAMAYLKIAKSATEIFIEQLDEHLAVSFFREEEIVLTDYVVSDEEMEQFRSYLPADFDPVDDQIRTRVAGINRTTHRIAAKMRGKQIVGYTLRVSRKSEGVIDPIAKYVDAALLRKDWILIGGMPGSSKTTVERELIPAIAEGRIGKGVAPYKKLCVIDRADELLGCGVANYKKVVRVHTPQTKMDNGKDADQKALEDAIRLRNPSLILIDELVAENVDYLIDSAVQVVASTHMSDIFKTLQTRGDIFGGVERVTSSDETAYANRGDATQKTFRNLGMGQSPFQMLILILEPGKYLIVEDVTSFLVKNLNGKSDYAMLVYYDESDTLIEKKVKFTAEKMDDKLLNVTVHGDGGESKSYKTSDNMKKWKEKKSQAQGSEEEIIEADEEITEADEEM